MVEFEKNVGLVYRVFNERFQQYRRYEDDLIQEGMIGLWKACQSFDESRGVAFSAYAFVCIRNEMGSYLRKELYRSSKNVSIDDVIDGEKGPTTYADILKATPKDIATQELFEEAMDIIKGTDCAEIVQMKLQGMSQVEIARKLGVTEVSISERLRGLYRFVREKMGVQGEEEKKNKKN